MTDDENTKKRLGDFEIIRELGRGGMGVVYEARQVSLNRKVALKVISSALGLSSKAEVRFKREAEAAGKLHHTNIVPIYATGEDDGTHYYAMELIDGSSLPDMLRRHEAPKSGKEVFSGIFKEHVQRDGPNENDVVRIRVVVDGRRTDRPV